VAFLRERRTALEQQVAALRRAIGVLDEKIDHYSGAPASASDPAPAASASASASAD
jgi:hypothetical protein